MKRQHVLAVLMFLLASSATLYAQGFYVETAHDRESGEKEEFYYMPKMFKSVDHDGTISIFRIDRQITYRITPETKTYSSMTFSQVKALMGNAKSKLNDMLEKRMAQLPPEQRKKLEEKMGAMKAQMNSSTVSYHVESTGQHKSISGYDCEKFLVNRDGKEFETVWATKQISGFESIKRDMKEMTDLFSSAMGRKGSINLWFNDIDGFPIQTESQDNVSVATKVEHRVIPSSEFEVPAGYTREKSSMEEALDSERP